ncbi:type IV secretory system conjugative DNA transfer family protein [Acidithiobacillus ferrooxidans]|jgi:defect-in-organelle-trafficking protein DotC|uniref:type IV secretory system conjugative DNA transfer family protein n=1 Tax=Acidithiobacillus ferrooxidans TaxID=920 RepID=UPI000B0D25F3|nr:type IV secretory system conjugative DNA transfer family protein [Acidithiobacillus ferrooxidans]
MWTLPDLQNLTKTQQIHVEHLKKNATPLNLQKKAIQQTAESYGAQGGLAWRAKQIDDKLEGLVPQLDSVYNFSHLALPGNVLPPVIEAGSQARMVHADALRTSTRDYRIVIPAQFRSVLPSWRTYLEQPYKQPKLSNIPLALLPHNAVQEAWWKDAAAIGWQAGEVEADALFRNGLSRLTRDIVGMIRYRRLMLAGEVKAPMIQQANLGVERDERVLGRAARMQVGVVLHRITLPAGFSNPHEWHVLPR